MFLINLAKIISFLSLLTLPIICQTNKINLLGNYIFGEAEQDHFGWSVSLSDNGRRIAIGGPDNDGSGVDAGHVRVYQLHNDQWLQLGQDIDGEQNRELSGGRLSLSKNGKFLAIGAPYNSEKHKYSGQVRLYKEIGEKWTKINGDLDGELSEDFFYWCTLNRSGSVLAIGSAFSDSIYHEGGSVRVFSIEDENLGISSRENIFPDKKFLFYNYPNPFNSSTKIIISDYENISKMAIYDILGVKINEFDLTKMNSNSQTILWKGKNFTDEYVNSGVYIYQLHFGDSIIKKKMLLIK